MRRIFSLLAMVMIAAAAVAQDSNPTDVSDLVSEFDEIGLPTVASVEELEQAAAAAYADEKWEEASEAYGNLSSSANWLANLIKSGLEPFYGASYDKRDEFPYAKLRPLIPIEELANSYIQLRNEAMVRNALCLREIGQEREAASLLYRALDLIDIENEALWTEAREALFSIIGVEL